MTVKDLIDQLAGYPSDLDVWYVWDGLARSPVELTWRSRNGQVVLSTWDDTVYDRNDRPDNADEDPYWRPKERLET